MKMYVPLSSIHGRFTGDTAPTDDDDNNDDDDDDDDVICYI